MSFNTIETTSSTPSSTSITPGSPPGAAQPGDFIGRWRVERTIGQGTYGKVRLAIDPLTLEKVAVKVIEKSQVQSNKQIARLQREIRFLRLLHHPHIVKVYEVLETDAFIHIIMEFASGGELFDYIVAHKRVKEREARSFFRQVLSAVDYCHKNAVIHRDLKPENLLLDETKTIKIIDFGFGNNFTVEGLLDTFCGSPFYAAPEMILGKKYEGPEVDMWSLGVILFALLCGHLPFDDENMKELYRKIANGSYTCPDHLLPSARHLISRLITVDPKRRATLAEVLSHSWVNDGYDGPPPNYLPERPVIRDTAQLSPTILERLYVFGYTPADVERAFGNSGGGKPDDRRETDPSPVRATYFLLAEMLAREQARATTTNAGGSRRGSLAFGSLGALSGPGGGAGGIANHASTSSLTRCASASMPNVSSSVTVPGAAVVGHNANNSTHHNAPPPRLAAATGPGAAAHAHHVPESQYAAGLMTLFGGNDRRASSPDARIARPPSHRGFVGGGLHPHHPGQHHLSPPPPPMPGALGADVANVQPPPNAKIRGQSSKVGPASPATTSSSSSGGGGSGGSSSLWATARSKPPTIPLPPTPTALSPVATVGPPPKEPSWLRRFSIPTVPSAHRHQQPVVAPTREVQSATIGGSPYITSPTSPHPPPPATILVSSSSSSSPPPPPALSADNTRRRGSLASVVTNTSSAAQLLLPGSTRIREELRAVSGWLFNVSTTTTKPVSEVMAQLVEILARHGVSYSIDDPNHIVNERGGGGGGSHGGAGTQSVQGGPYGSDETHAVFCEADVAIAQDASASASAAVIPVAADATTHLFRSSSSSRRQSIHGSGVAPAYAYPSASQPQFLTRSASVSSASSAAATTTNPKSPSSRTLGASSSSNNNENNNNNGGARGGGGGGSNGSLTESTASSSSSSSAHAQKQPQPQPKHAPHNNDNIVPPEVSSQHPKHKPRKASLHTQHQYHSQPTALATPPSREKHHWRNHHHHQHHHHHSHNYNHHHHHTQNQQPKQTVSFQITVSRLARVNHLTGVHFKRLHGGVWTYKKICNKLLSQMNL